MKPNCKFRICSFALSALLAGMCAYSDVSKPDQSQEYIAQPASDKRNQGIANDYKIESKEGSKTIKLYAGLRSCKKINHASAKIGPNFLSSLPDSGWKMDEIKGVWHMVVDVSDPTRDKIIIKQLEELSDLIKALPIQDEIHLYALGAGIKKWGYSKGDKIELRRKINALIKDKSFEGKDFRLSSLIFSNVRSVIDEINTNGEDGSLKHTILLLSDGMDETREHESQRQKELVISEAKQKQITISTLGYADRQRDRGGFPALRDISSQTGGVHFEANLSGHFESPKEVNERVINCIHNKRGSFDIDLNSLTNPQDIKIIFQSDEQEDAYLFVPASYVQEAIKEAESKKETDLKTQKDESLSRELQESEQLISSMQEKLKQLERFERADSTPNEELNDLVKSLSEISASLISKLKTLSKTDIDVLKKGLDEEKESSDCSDEKKKILDLILQMVEETKANQINNEKDVLKLMGRDKDLPIVNNNVPLVEDEQKPLAPWVVPASVCGGVLLLGFIFVFTKGKKKSPVAVDIQQHRGKHIQRKVLATVSSLEGNRERWNISQPSVKIGRGSHNDIQITNNSISASHCVIKQNRDGDWSIVDLDSANGVYINKVKKAQSYLHDGDVIELGDTHLQFNVI